MSKAEAQNGLMLVDIIEVDLKGWTIVEGELFDETKFQLKVRNHFLQPIESEKLNRGWLSVEFHGQREMQASISLPEPAPDFGHNVTINMSRFKRPD